VSSGIFKASQLSKLFISVTYAYAKKRNKKMATTLQRCNCQQAMKRRTSTRSRRKRQTVGCHMSCSSLKIPQRDLYACECECECVWLCMWVCGHCTPRESCNILSTRLMCLVRRCSDNRSPGHQKDEPALDKERKREIERERDTEEICKV